MEQEPNQAGGENVWVVPEEDLASVPISHRALVTAEIRRAFASPKEYFLEISRRVPISGFSQYLAQLVTTGRCALLLATAEEMFGGPQAAFQWWVPSRSTAPRQLLIEPGGMEPSKSPDPVLGQLFSTVSWLHWDEFGCSGGLHRPDALRTVQQDGAPCKSKQFPAKTTFVFGRISCGDMLICNAKGEAGFLSHENGKAYSLGNMADALNWIFEELRQGREPQFDYERVR